MFRILHLQHQVRMAERSKALRSGRSPLLWAWVRIPLLTKTFLPCSWLYCIRNGSKVDRLADSRVAQWKRAGPITQRSVDRNYALLVECLILFSSFRIAGAHPQCILSAVVPLAQRIARWTSNPKVLGSIPRWDEQSLVAWCSGYHVCFTRRRSPVRSWARSLFFGFRLQNIRLKNF